MSNLCSTVGKVANCIRKGLSMSTWNIQLGSGQTHEVLVSNSKDVFKNYRIMFTPEGDYIINLDD